jgi:hypothetical protein
LNLGAAGFTSIDDDRDERVDMDDRISEAERGYRREKSIQLRVKEVAAAALVYK